MKKAVLLAAALAAAALAGGCSEKEVEPGSIAGFDEGEQYIEMWTYTIEDTPEGEACKEAIEKFNGAFDGKYFASVEFIPRNDNGGGYSDKINASVMSGDLPDVIAVDGPNISAYAANGIIQPLAELTDEEKGVYLESIIDQGTVDGKLYALGAMESSVGLYCNKDILAQAGIEIPDADHPWTWTEFAEILEKLKPVMEAKNGYPIDMTFPVGETSIYLYAPFIWANGGDLVSPDGLMADGYFNSEQNVKAMEYFKMLADKGYMSKTPIEQLFESGRAAFKIDGAWEVNTIYESYPDIHLGVAPYVVGDSWNGEKYAPSGSWAYAATTNTKNLEASTELIKWISGTDSSMLLFEKYKSLPSTYEAYERI